VRENNRELKAENEALRRDNEALRNEVREMRVELKALAKPGLSQAWQAAPSTLKVPFQGT
jgi:predicted RNase H-like nuclease (RuvC/YqgF family)